MAAKTKKAIDDAIRTVLACNRSPSALSIAIARPSATMPTVVFSFSGDYPIRI